MSKIKSMEVTTARDIIEKERERLRESRVRNKEWWQDTSSSDWARKNFGDNLDVPISDEMIRIYGEECNICERIPALDEQFLHLEFSFCDEYNCGMYICKGCLKSMWKKVKV